MCDPLWPVNPKLNATDDFQPYQDTSILWRCSGQHSALKPFQSVIATDQTLSQGSG
jgi:hypothetical protein